MKKNRLFFFLDKIYFCSKSGDFAQQGLLFLQFVLSLSQIYKKEFQFFPYTPLAQNRCYQQY
jgi:hypothetical protein